MQWLLRAEDAAGAPNKSKMAQVASSPTPDAAAITSSQHFEVPNLEKAPTHSTYSVGAKRTQLHISGPWGLVLAPARSSAREPYSAASSSKASDASTVSKSATLLKCMAFARSCWVSISPEQQIRRRVLQPLRFDKVLSCRNNND